MLQDFCLIAHSYLLTINFNYKKGVIMNLEQKKDILKKYKELYPDNIDIKDNDVTFFNYEDPNENITIKYNLRNAKASIEVYADLNKKPIGREEVVASFSEVILNAVGAVLPIKEEIVISLNRDVIKTKGKPFKLKEVDPKNTLLLPRSVAENYPEFPHIIPYFCVGNTKGEYLIYDRKGTEKRLHGFKSIGWGGHLNLDDLAKDNPVELSDVIFNGMKREFKEELDMDLLDCLTHYIYAYYDDKTPVNSVHICLAHEVLILEPEQEEAFTEFGEWKTIHDIDVNSLEPWSRVMINFLKNKGENE